MLYIHVVQGIEGGTDKLMLFLTKGGGNLSQMVQIRREE